MKSIVLFILILFFYSCLNAQQVKTNTDTVELVSDSFPKHSPRTATFLSLALPGLGQAYNKKYWKIPVVYAAIGVPLYFALDQQQQFNEFKDAYVSRVDDDPSTSDDKFMGVYTDQNLLNLIDDTRQNRDLLFVLTGVAYALNVLDAAVDAHLYYFEVSDDLTADLRPTFKLAPNQALVVPSLTLTLKFNKKTHRNPF